MPVGISPDGSNQKVEIVCNIRLLSQLVNDKCSANTRLLRRVISLRIGGLFHSVSQISAGSKSNDQGARC